MFEHIKTTAERFTTLPIPTVVMEAHKRSVYSVPVTALAGDKMIFSFCGEVTNPHQFNVMLGRGAILASGPNATSGTPVIPLATENITPGEHHKIFSGSAVHSFSADFSGHLNVIIYAGASASQGHEAPIEQGYGLLDVALFRAPQQVPENPPPQTGSVTLTAEQVSALKAALIAGKEARDAVMEWF